MKAVITVTGKDTVGIIADVATVCAKHGANILDITQTVLQEYFTMVMLVDTAACSESIGDMADILRKAGEEQELVIRIQREDIFNAMHRI